MKLDVATDPVAIETLGLTKRYGQTLAVSDLHMVVERGAICGFIGPNGAGKSSTIRMLLGLSRPTAGHFLLFGREASGQAGLIASEIAPLLEYSPAYPYLTGYEMLRVTCQAAHQKVSRTELLAALDRFGLAAASDRRVGAYSQGMRQRLGLAFVCLVHRRIVVLDEPMSGLDPQGQADFRGFLADLHREGRTVVLSSHILQHVQDTCSHLVILNRGQLVAAGPTRSLLATRRTHILARPGTVAMAIAERYPGVAVDAVDGAAVLLDCSSDAAESLTGALVAGGAEILRLEQRQVSLSTLFLELTAESRKDADIAEPSPR